jgi:enoyl reductase-like protein
VAILQGPVAVRHLIKKDEPVEEMLDNVVSGLTAKVLECFYGGDESKIPCNRLPWCEGQRNLRHNDFGGVQVAGTQQCSHWHWHGASWETPKIKGRDN